VLDLRMPRVSGVDVLRTLRSAGEGVPVVVLTGVSDERWVLSAFEAGADDYVTKPFPPRVLVARVRAVIRRAQPGWPDQDGGVLDGGEIALDASSRHALVGGQTVPLSPIEFLLLRTLMRAGGRVLTAADLLARVWGPHYLGDDDLVRANIYRLRLKLEPVPSAPRYVRGRRGVGYYFTGRGQSADEAGPCTRGALT
jgi:DNA-binding response OmpR family regulator